MRVPANNAIMRVRSGVSLLFREALQSEGALIMRQIFIPSPANIVLLNRNSLLYFLSSSLTLGSPRISLPFPDWPVLLQFLMFFSSSVSHVFFSSVSDVFFSFSFWNFFLLTFLFIVECKSSYIRLTVFWYIMNHYCYLRNL